MDKQQAAQRLREVLAWLEETPVLSQATSTPPLVEQASVPGLKDEAAFYNHLRGTNVLGPKISPNEFQGCKLILEHCAGARLSAIDTGYLLATAYHETAGTMQPIDEMGGNSYFTRLYDVQGINPERARRMGNVNPGDGIKWHGRGFVMLTWYDNYVRAKKELGVDVVGNPELAKEPSVAAQILVIGCVQGWFTGKKLSDFSSLVEKRRVVNGTDKAEHIADIARVFIKGLEAGQWA